MSPMTWVDRSPRMPPVPIRSSPGMRRPAPSPSFSAEPYLLSALRMIRQSATVAPFPSSWTRSGLMSSSMISGWLTTMSESRTMSLFDDLDIRLRPAPEPGEDLVALDLADHPVGLVAVDGGEAEDDVLEELDEDAAQTEHDQRSHGIAVHPEDHLIAPARPSAGRGPLRGRPRDRSSSRSP